MNKWKEVLVSANASIRQVMQKLESSALQIVLVVDEKDHLLGTVTDGDIRRGILRSLSLTDSVHKVMNSNPKVAKVNESRESAFAIMRRSGIHHLPIVDEDGRLMDMETLDDLIQTRTKQNRVVLM